MPEWLLSALQIVGLCLFVTGMWMFWHPGAFLVAGAVIVAWGELNSRSEGGQRR